MTRYGITTDYDYSTTHKRERLAIWSAPFMSTFEGDALSLPNGKGYMITTSAGDKIRVECEAPRTDANYQAVDAAIGAALNCARLEYLRSQIEAERISYFEISELQNLTEFIQPGDTQLLEWAGVPEGAATK